MSTVRRAGPARLEELSVSRALRLYARGLALRCPHCAGDRLVQTWFRLKHKCGACGLRTNRGEEDFFLGGMMWNIVFSEGALLVGALAMGIVTWPDVPWTLMQWAGIVLMVLAPFVLYPFSLTVWLASDILIRPVGQAEMEWHRGSRPDEFRSYRDR